MKTEIICIDCGRIEYHDRRRKYCDDCRKKRKGLASNKKRNSKNKSKREWKPRIPYNLSDQEKVDWYLLNRTERMGDCIVWTGSKTKEGYGRAAFNSKTTDTPLVHRFFYLVQVEATSEPLHHTCENTSCVNTEHLIPTSQAENTLEMLTRRGLQAHIEELEARIFELENPEIGTVIC